MCCLKQDFQDFRISRIWRRVHMPGQPQGLPLHHGLDLVPGHGQSRQYLVRASRPRSHFYQRPKSMDSRLRGNGGFCGSAKLRSEIAPGPGEENGDQALGVGVGVAAAAAVQEIIGRREGGEPETGPAKPLYQALRVGREFMVGRGYEPAVAIVVGHPAHLDDGQCVDHFPAEGVDAGP